MEEPSRQSGPRFHLQASEALDQSSARDRSFLRRAWDWEQGRDNLDILKPLKRNKEPKYPEPTL